MELLLHITWYHNSLLKQKISPDDHNLSGVIKIILEVIAPKILTNMIALDMKINYDNALVVFYYCKVHLYGEQQEVDEILEVFKLELREEEHNRLYRRRGQSLDVPEITKNSFRE
ncbi:hypothetical protein RUND412_011165 [Rhizina undulata]